MSVCASRKCVIMYVCEGQLVFSTTSLQEHFISLTFSKHSAARSVGSRSSLEFQSCVVNRISHGAHTYLLYISINFHGDVDRSFLLRNHTRVSTVHSRTHALHHVRFPLLRLCVTLSLSLLLVIRYCMLLNIINNNNNNT